VQKVGNFSQEHVKQLRADLKTLYDKVKGQKAGSDSDKDAMVAVCDGVCLLSIKTLILHGWHCCVSLHRCIVCLLQEAHRIGDEYLALEKFVNLNYMVGRHDICWEVSKTRLQSCP